MTYLGRGTRDTVVPYGLGQSAESSSCMLKIRPSRERFGRIGVRQIEFPSAVEANPVCAVFNREHTAEVAVAASKNELEDTQKHVHKSCARWRRSQLPLASSHSSRERILARANATEQSAAP